MRRTREMVAGAAVAIALGLTGCGGDEPAMEESPAVGEEEVGSPDPVDGGEEDPDGIDKGTGGLDDDDNVGDNPADTSEEDDDDMPDSGG